MRDTRENFKKTTIVVPWLAVPGCIWIGKVIVIKHHTAKACEGAEVTDVNVSDQLVLSALHYAEERPMCLA
jgi:hypothetical protein